MTSVEKQQHHASSLWQELLEAGSPVAPAMAYLLYVTAVEIVVVQVEVATGVFLHLAGLFLLIWHTARIWKEGQSRLLMSLALVPVIRIVSLVLPLTGLPLMYWYLITSVPLFVAAAVVMRLLGMGLNLEALGFRRRASLRHHTLQIVFGLGGLVLGYIEYLILRPQPLVASFTLAAIWLPTLVLMVSMGYMEELIFRRILQRTSVEQLGAWPGVVYVAVLFAVLHIGYQSLADILFVFLVSLGFGLFVRRTGSLVGVTLAHGLTNIALFLIVPFWAAGALPLPAMPEISLPSLSDLEAEVRPTRTSQPLIPGVGLPRNAAYLSTPWAAPTRTPLPPTSTPTVDPKATSTPSGPPGSGAGALHTASPTATLTPTASTTPTPTPCGPPAGWVVHRVQAGETLYGIAMRTGLTLSELQAANCLASLSLFAGQALYVPFALPQPSATTVSPSPTVGSPSASATSMPDGDAATPTTMPELEDTATPAPTANPTNTAQPTPTSQPPTATPPLPETATPQPQPTPTVEPPDPTSEPPTATPPSPGERQ